MGGCCLLHVPLGLDSEGAHPPTLTKAVGEGDLGARRRLCFGCYPLLTCCRWAWPNIYFLGGLVWAGIGPDAARTAAGRFATRQEKSVDSTQFRPSTLPRRMFPSNAAAFFL